MGQCQQLENIQKNAIKTKILPDGRYRYYKAERLSTNPGMTRGSSYVIEYNPINGKTRGWNECYDHFGKVNRVHPKDLNGQNLNSQHYPPTKREL
ncbi:MAG TPA: hypothetical protein PLC42_02035 [Parachlamydiaceae bacterium]|nr:hypothetical protein [Parachlamydiaceae bacterium]